MKRELSADDLNERRSDPRYQRLMAVTRRAARHGYDAVSMRDIAREAQVSMTTVYQFCTSKDHLIAEAHLEWMEDFRQKMLVTTPRGRTPAARAKAFVGQITDAWENQPVLTMTLQRAVYSGDPGVREVRALIGGSFRSIMEAAIGDAEIHDREVVIEVVGHLIDSVTYEWVCGKYDVAEARRVLERMIGVILRQAVR